MHRVIVDANNPAQILPRISGHFRLGLTTKYLFSLIMPIDCVRACVCVSEIGTYIIITTIFQKNVLNYTITKNLHFFFLYLIRSIIAIRYSICYSKEQIRLSLYKSYLLPVSVAHTLINYNSNYTVLYTKLMKFTVIYFMLLKIQCEKYRGRV